MLGQNQLLTPEAKEKRHQILKDAGYSESAIEDFEEITNQKEKYELLRDAMETLSMKGHAQEVARKDRAAGYDASDKKVWPTFGD